MDFPPPAGSEPIQAAAPPPPPLGSEALSMSPPPPSGSLPLDAPEPPQGSVPLSDTVPGSLPTQKGNTEVPGFWSTVGSSLYRGTASRIQADIDAGRIAGGVTPEQQYQEQLRTPQAEDEIDRLLKQGVYTGWSDPKWIGAQIAHGTGSMLPGLGAGAAGALVGGPIGAVAGFSGEAAWGSFIPAYKAARAAGLEPEEATKRALIDSGISAATATAMGLVPGVAVFGKVANPLVTDQVATMMARPTLEAIAQLGIIQPSLGTAGEAIKTLSHGETPGAEEILTNFVAGAGMGVVPVGAHTAWRGIRSAADRLPTAPPASPEEVQAAFVGQQPKSALVDGEAAPVESFEGPLATRQGGIFYSPVLEAIHNKVPEKASPDQILATLRNTPGVKEEEINDLNLPGYLKDAGGKVNKQDLLAHVEANGLQLEEARASDAPYQNWDNYTTQLMDKYGDGLSTIFANMTPEERLEYDRLHKIADERAGDRTPEHASQVAPGEHSNYREFFLKVPERGPRLPDKNVYDPTVPKGWQTTGEVGPRVDPSKNFKDPVHDSFPLNTVSWFRTTDRVDRDGRKLLHIEEIQSQLHQMGRKQGYLAPGEKREDLDELERVMDRARFVYDQNGGDIARQKLQEARNAFQKALAQQEKLPDLPFKTAWPELTVKRILRLAADEGYEGVSWANGDQVGLRLADSDQLRGNREFYDKKIPSIFKHWAKKLGMEIGTTRLEGASDVGEALSKIVTPAARDARAQRYAEMGLTADKFNDRNGFVKVNPAAGSRVQMGLPLYDKDVTPGGRKLHTLSERLPQGTPAALKGAAKKIDQTIRSVASELKISRDIAFNVVNDPNMRFRGRLRPDLDPATGNYVVDVNTHWLRTPEDLYSSMSHEFGHVIEHNLLETASKVEQAKVWQAFDAFRKALPQGDITVGDVRRLRDNAVSEISGARNLHDQLRLSELEPGSKAYLLHRSEWFAEQVAKWMQTDSRPMGHLEKFFKSVANKIKKMLGTFQRLRGQSPEASAAVRDWLNSRYDNPVDWTAAIKEQFDLDTTRENGDALERDGTPEVTPTPQTASTGGGRGILDNLPPDGSSAGPAMAAHADRMNRFYEWMTSLPQIASLNKHIRGLTNYKEIVATMNIQKNTIMSSAADTLHAWKMIRDPKQLFALNKFIEDYANGFFKLVDDGQTRRPTKPEFDALAAKHKISGQSLKIFNRLVGDFDTFLESYRGLLLADAAKIKDPLAQLQAMKDANARVDKLLQRPFFPMLRFGKYNITVYDSKGNVRHYEQTDSLRKQAQIVEALNKSPDLLPGDKVLPGMVAKDVAPLLGLPPGMLDLLENKLNLSTTQRAALDQLRFDYAPSQSFKHQFKTHDVTPGYSTDFQRAYANFFFHGANHVTRLQWVDQLRDQMRSVRSERMDRENANKIDRIANYMQQHFDMLVDPKPDFAALRGMMFHWFLGFNPASATLNLSQTAIMTHPHLASKFGDFKSLLAITRAGTELNNFYKKGTLQELGKVVPGEPTPPMKFRALAEAVKEGVISETQAHTLAAVSEDRNLLRAFGSKGEAAWQRFSSASSWMFEMTEQYNRRVAFRAAWNLAMKDVNNKYVQETIRDNPLQYKRLRDQDWSHQEAAAFTAAKDSVEKTQFVYAPYSRPKFMWGRKGALFIFKSFVQNTLFNLWSNPAMGARSLLIMGVLGGMMGLPGMENINGILKALAWKLFGKDFDVEDEARKFAVDVLHGAINPDLLLHGTSVHGFGIPHVLNMMGHQAGLPEKVFPALDRSKAIGMGDITGVDVGKLLGPSKDYKGMELQQLQHAAGAAFGNGFALYNFLTAQESLGDLKRWELVMPKAFSNVSHAFRYLSEGRERNRAGNTVVRFDPQDTEQMAEILARAGGYQPRRLSARYEQMAAQTEAATYWDLRRGILLRQFGEAVKGNDAESRQKVISAVREYNKELPEEWKPKAISAQALKESVMQRMKNSAKQEAGLPLAKSNILGAQSMDKYFPDGRPTGQVDARPVK